MDYDNVFLKDYSYSKSAVCSAPALLKLYEIVINLFYHFKRARDKIYMGVRRVPDKGHLSSAALKGSRQNCLALKGTRRICLALEGADELHKDTRQPCLAPEGSRQTCLALKGARRTCLVLEGTQKTTQRHKSNLCCP
jgi:hypothetical protein